MRKYHWIPDLPDHRDKLYAHAAISIPAKIDLRNICSTVENQANLGSCTGNALVGAMECLENIEKTQFVDLSRLFVYYNERALEHTISQDAGALIRDGIKSLASTGVCTEALWPYDIAKFKKKPTAPCFKDATIRKISSYNRLTTLGDMQNCLAAGFPFVFGFSVYESFEGPAVAKTGIVNMPTKDEKCLGGHAVLCVGYDNATKRFLVRNSWGNEWGMAGFFTIPYDYLTNRSLSDDFWTIRK